VWLEGLGKTKKFNDLIEARTGNQLRYRVPPPPPIEFVVNFFMDDILHMHLGNERQWSQKGLACRKCTASSCDTLPIFLNILLIKRKVLAASSCLHGLYAGYLVFRSVW
jgi:hypothetical protein